MTGIYLRVKRNGKFHNLEIEHLTPEELELVFKDRQSDELINWIAALTSVIRKFEPILEYLDKEP